MFDSVLNLGQEIKPRSNEQSHLFIDIYFSQIHLQHILTGHKKSYEIELEALETLFGLCRRLLSILFATFTTLLDGYWIISRSLVAHFENVP